MDEARRSQPGEYQALANLYRCPQITIAALATRDHVSRFAVRPIARERDRMQLAGSVLRLLSLIALTILCVCTTRADEKTMMRVVFPHESGKHDVLKIEQVPRPEPKQNEALVRV